MSHKPNVIIFLTDQQRWDTSSFYGNPLNVTPVYDRMAREGTHFQNAFTCQPVCGPARSCLQTGRYATNTGVHINHIGLPEGSHTLAKSFNEAGYQTGYIGKWHLGGIKPNMEGEPQHPVPAHRRGGYQYWLAADLVEFCSEEYNTVLFDNNDKPVSLPGYRVDATVDAGIRFIDKNKEKPFFLMVSLLEPHFQNTRDHYPAPTGCAEEFTGRWMPPDLAALGGTAHQQIGGYFGMVKRIDEAFGRMLDAVKSLGLDNKTIIAYSSDHGCHFKTRNEEYKRSGHDSSIRIPMAVTGPGFFGGGCVKNMMSLVNLPATLLDAAGLDVPESMEGESYMPVLSGSSDDWADDVFIQISESQIGRAVRTHRWKYGVVATSGDPYNDKSAEEYRDSYLYDLYADPWELENLIAVPQYAKVVQKMEFRLKKRMADAGEKIPTILRPLETRSYEGRWVSDGEADE